MTIQICPKCKSKNITWSHDEEASLNTIWWCNKCDYTAEENEAMAIDCPKCKSAKSYLLIIDGDGVHRWCHNCQLFEKKPALDCLNVEMTLQKVSMAAQPPPTFMFNEMVVGEFSDGYPNVIGDFTYMPYRGPGHFQMQKVLKESGQAICSFRSGTKCYYVTVIGCPKYGVLTSSVIGETNETPN